MAGGLAAYFKKLRHLPSPSDFSKVWPDFLDYLGIKDADRLFNCGRPDSARVRNVVGVHVSAACIRDSSQSTPKETALGVNPFSDSAPPHGSALVCKRRFCPL